MDTYAKERADFEAIIRIRSAVEGGRTTPPHNRIRWDLSYADEPDKLHMIWPDFIDAKGVSIVGALPICEELRARLFVVAREAVSFHRERLLVGTEFRCHEGRRVVADGVVTKLLEPSHRDFE